MVYGDYALVDAGNPRVYAFTRSLGGERLLVLLNFGDAAAEAALPEGMVPGEELINNYPDGASEGLHLKPWQAVIYRLEKAQTKNHP